MTTINRPTVIEVVPAPHGLSVRLDGGLLVPRLISTSGHSCTVALVAGGAMLLPGDCVELQVRVGPGCALELLDVGGLVVHGRPEDDTAGYWRARLELDADARLTWAALPTVITDQGRLVRSTDVVLADGARAVIRETIAFGRVGERGGALDASTRVEDRQGPLVMERLLADAAHPQPGILGAHRLMDTMLYLGLDQVDDRVSQPADEAGDERATPDGVTRLDFERGGWLLRWLGSQAHLSPL